MQFPEVGTPVEVEIDTLQTHNSLTPDAKHRCAPVTTLKGVVIQRLSWMPEYFTILNSETKATNLIAYHRIISINKQKFEQPAPVQDKTVKIKSSNGKDTYTVMLNGHTKKWSCNCAGYQFKRKCRHTLEAQTV